MSTPKQSRVFKIPELCGLIVDMMPPTRIPWPKKENESPGRDLARLACVSSFFSDHALEKLWQNLPDMQPLVRLLPIDSYELSYANSESHLQFTRQLTSQDFTRLDLYSVRVREIRFYTEEASFPISVLSRGQVLLPKLETLWCHVGHITEGLRALLRPPIKSLLIFTVYDDTTLYPLTDVISTLPSALPGLESLEFNDNAQPDSLDAIIHIPDVLHLLPNLTRFIFDLMPEISFIERLSGLPTLQELVLSRLPDFDGTILRSQGFPSLKKLDLSGGTSNIAVLLKSIYSASLAEAALTFHDPETDQLVALCVSHLGSSHSASLRSVTIDWFDEGALSLSSFAPLHQCHLLDTVIFDGGLGHMFVLDEDIEAMAMAWPALKNFFILQTRDTVNVAPQVTLRSLQLLAKHCSALTQLLISVDATAVPAYATLPSLLRSSLRNLVLLDSICGAVDDVATFLQCTFPGLPRLLATEWLQDVPTRYPTQSSGKWVDVSSRMPSLEPWNVDLNLRIGTNFNALK